MTPFAIEWTDEALENLTEAWLQAAHPEEVTDAEMRMNAMLRDDPVRHGELLSEDLWIVRVHPLKIYFEIWETERVVQVTDALLIDK